MIVTGTNAAFGLFFGTIAGVLTAFLLSRSKILDQLVTPMSVAVNAIPAFVLVSVFNNMFSTTSVVPRRLMVSLVVFFIVLVNVATGLRQVDPTHTELMRSYAASNWEIMRKVRVPNAVPYLFNALKVAAPLSVIYAYVSEYFGGAQNGLGSRITSNIANSKNAVGWAYVLGACLLGLAFYLISIAMEAVATPGGAGPHSREGS
jgi:NitT/TauT family transport system permease protein